ncbi:MAG TPA: flagellar protein FlgN [Opitutus sp.]|nr:flagellar protein FlgN [Opitutus sp.]
MNWQSIAENLRQELTEYGELLRLFEQQQESLFKRESDAVLQLGTQIEDQAHILQDCRRQREKTVAAFAALVGQPAAATLRSLLPHVESDARPLLEALINEVNVLLHRVRRASRQNHLMLGRTLELHQETLRQLRPDSFTKTYAATGRVSVAAAGGAPSLRAAG